MGVKIMAIIESGGEEINGEEKQSMAWRRKYQQTKIERKSIENISERKQRNQSENNQKGISESNQCEIA